MRWAVAAVYLRSREAVICGRGPKEEQGQGMVEYPFILVLIAVVAIIIVAVVGKQVKNVFSNVDNGLSF